MIAADSERFTRLADICCCIPSHLDFDGTDFDIVEIFAELTLC